MNEKNNYPGRLILMLFFLMIPLFPLAASTAEYGTDLTHNMMVLAVQLGVIIFAARFGGVTARKMKIPPVLGELLAGIIVGPYALGALPLPLLRGGIFPVTPGVVPVSVELYGFATVASIILLFMTGLETDLALFIKYSLPGTVIGIGGGAAAFIIGAWAGAWFTGTPFGNPPNLFLGVLSIAASVGITARILSEKRKMDSPEGVTILAAAVIQDVLGIVALAVVVGIAAVMTDGGGNGPEWAGIIGIAVKALGVWLGVTVIGLLLAKKIGIFLKSFKSRTGFSVLALGLALLLAGFFEQAGLAMIIGAYVMGLTLSKTDIALVIQEKLNPLYAFFVPIFFTVMGMLVNMRILLSTEVLLFGLVFSVTAFIGKLLGGAIPAMFLNFNALGATRIGTGIACRGEVALIIAGIGISSGILSEPLFGVAIVMILFTTLLSPTMLAALVQIPKKGTRKETKSDSVVTTSFNFPSEEMTGLVVAKVITAMESEGFFIHRIEMGHVVYHMRRDDKSITLTCLEQDLMFDSNDKDVGFVKTVVYECLVGLHETINNLKKVAKPETLRKELAEGGNTGGFDPTSYLDPRCVTLSLRAVAKEELITEMVDLLDRAGKVVDRQTVLHDVIERERTLSTGMQDGLAFPHAKTDGVSRMSFAVGIRKDGIDFSSIDGKPSTLFIMILSPKKSPGPHLQLLSSLAGLLTEDAPRKALLECGSASEVAAFFAGGNRKSGKR